VSKKIADWGTETQWCTQKFFFGGGVQQIQLRTEGRENRDLGAVAPYSRVPPNLQMGETHILIRFLGCIFHRTGNSARLCQKFGIISGEFQTPPNPPPPPGTPVPRPTRNTRVVTAGSFQLCIEHDAFPPQTANCCIFYLKNVYSYRNEMKCLLTPRVSALLKSGKPFFPPLPERWCTRSRLVHPSAVHLVVFLLDIICNVYSLVNEWVLITSRRLCLLIYLTTLFSLQNL
jgi:hypothetical protein